MEDGEQLGYEVIPFYRIYKAANPDALPLREGFNIENYILMGASNLQTAFAAMVTLYMACTFWLNQVLTDYFGQIRNLAH